MYIYSEACMYIYVYIFCMKVAVSLFVCAYMYIEGCMLYVYIHIYIFCMDVALSRFACVHIYIEACICICVDIHILCESRAVTFCVYVYVY